MLVKIVDNFWRNSLRARGNFEQENGVLETLIINYCYVLIVCYYYKKLLQGKRQNTIFETIFVSLFKQSVTHHRFWFV
jgi:hypothetical protein